MDMPTFIAPRYNFGHRVKVLPAVKESDLTLHVGEIGVVNRARCTLCATIEEDGKMRTQDCGWHYELKFGERIYGDYPEKQLSFPPFRLTTNLRECDLDAHSTSTHTVLYRGALGWVIAESDEFPDDVFVQMRRDVAGRTQWWIPRRYLEME